MTKLKTIGMAAVLALGLPLAAFANKGTGDEMKEIDTNADGKISASEHETYARNRFTKMDTNTDGKVTAEEMTTAMAEKGKPAAKGDMTVADKIKKMDTNADGAVSSEEFATAKKAKFTEMDKDKDGLVTMAEMRTAHEEMEKQKVKGTEEKDDKGADKGAEKTK